MWECACRTPTAEGDHAKYVNEYADHGIKVYSNKDVAEKKSFPFGTSVIIEGGKTYHIGGFSVVPFDVNHDVPCEGFLVYHKSIGKLLFVTDTFKIPIAITGIDHYLIEANYSDELLKENVWNGKINKAQADRIMLSHMSLDYCIRYLRDCQADRSAKTITLCHLSERNSAPEAFRSAVAGAFGVPTFVAEKNVIVELNRCEI